MRGNRLARSTSFVMLAFAGGLATNCRAHSTHETNPDANTNGGSSSSTEFPPLDTGSKLERTCSTSPNGIELPVGTVTCTLLGDVGRLRLNVANPDTPLLSVTYDGLTPGQASTADGTNTDVLLLGPCPARAQGSPEPCLVELVTLTRAATPATGGEIEPGSSVELHVSCPESLQNDTSDAVSTTRQAPQRFALIARDCAAF